jgi:hypothetical protein
VFPAELISGLNKYTHFRLDNLKIDALLNRRTSPGSVRTPAR